MICDPKRSVVFTIYAWFLLGNFPPLSMFDICSYFCWSKYHVGYVRAPVRLVPGRHLTAIATSAEEHLCLWTDQWLQSLIVLPHGYGSKYVEIISLKFNSNINTFSTKFMKDFIARVDQFCGSYHFDPFEFWVRMAYQWPGGVRSTRVAHSSTYNII